MRKIITCVLMLIVTTHSFSQQTIHSQPSFDNNLLLKSKQQRISAWLLLSSGVILASVGLVKFRNDFDLLGADNGQTGDLIIFAFGTGLIGGSVILFSIANKNRKKGMKYSTFFKMETAPIIQKNSFVRASFPALSVKINL